MPLNISYLFAIILLQQSDSEFQRMSYWRVIIMTLATADQEKGKSDFRLKVEMENFGPINSGTITVKPLTLFIGPNNSGKSYAAMLINSIFESYNTARERAFLFSTSYRKELDELKNQITALNQDKEFEIPKKFVDSITNQISREIYERRLGEEIRRSYASPINELVKIGKGDFMIGFGFDSFNILLKYQNGEFKIIDFPQPNSDKLLDTFIVRVVKGYNQTIIQKEDTEKIIIKIPENTDDETALDLISDKLFNSLFTRFTGVLNKMAMPCYYLPAARSGIMQSYKAIAASKVRDEPIKMSGVVSEFISSIITLQERKGPFYEFAQELEDEIINGETVIKDLDEYHREIMYKFRNVEIPLHRASSTVSELVPLFLYLKYKVTPNSVLIIEEPEAHLHPANQRILAKYLVRLVRKGVYIIATTHSEYFLEQIDNFVLLSEIDPEKRSKEYNYNEDDFLKYDEVGVYEFHYDKATGSSEIKEAEVTKDGVSQEEFVRVLDELYEETGKLRSELDSDE